MSSSNKDFGIFLNNIREKTVAIVYSFSNRVDQKKTWYDRWRSDVVFFFGIGVERLGAEPRYLDVEQYLQIMCARVDTPGDFIINLHSGLIDIGSWPIISSVARWRRIPIAPCSSDVHIVGERKDLSNLLAIKSGMTLPEVYDPNTPSDTLYIRKPRDLGMSRGIQFVQACELDPTTCGTDIIQKYVPGLDATVGVVRQPNGQYTVIGAQLLVPHAENNEPWIFCEQDKVSEDTTPTISRRPVTIDAVMCKSIYSLCEAVGTSSNYRLDFRVSGSAQSQPTQLNLTNSYFLEANPTPTISRGSSFGAMFADLIEDECDTKYDFDETLLPMLQDLGVEGGLVALSLFNAARTAANN